MVQPPNVSLETSVSRSAAFKYCFVLFLAYRCIGAIPFLTLTSLLSFVIPHLFRTNDDPVERRKLMNNWKDREVKVFSGDDEIDVREEYVVNKRAMCLMSTTMRPLRRPIKAVLCFCHGYADNPYNLTRWAYRLLVYAGYAMVILEYEGHGRSDGLLGFIPSWDLLVDDAVTHFRNVLKKERDFRQKKCFLVGESMGGAVCFSSYLKCPNFWDGIIFVAPMCKISEEVKPPQWVIDLLLKIIGPSGSINFFGKLPLSPSSDYDELIFKDKLVLQAFREVPTAYNRKPRLATARELLNATDMIGNNLSKMRARFLVLHGKDDIVTCPALSQALYSEAASKDKTIKLYDNMNHAITGGECKQQIEKVFQDMIGWLDDRI